MTRLKLPKQIKVRVEKCSEGKYHATLQDYNVHTTANDEMELLYMVNDLIFCYFDIPADFHNKIFYKPENLSSDFDKVKPYIRLTSADVIKNLHG